MLGELSYPTPPSGKAARILRVVVLMIASRWIPCSTLEQDCSLVATSVTPSGRMQSTGPHRFGVSVSVLTGMAHRETHLPRGVQVPRR